MRNGELADNKKMSALDWGILALIVLLLGVAAVWYFQRGSGAGETREIRYTVRVSGVDVEGAESEFLPIGRGDTVRSENGTLELGYIESVAVRQSRTAAISKGEIVFSEVPGRVDVDVSVRGTALYLEGDGLRVSDVRIAAGVKGDFRLGGYYAKGATVIFVTEVTE